MEVHADSMTQVPVVEGICTHFVTVCAAGPCMYH